MAASTPIPYLPITIDSKDFDNEVMKLFAEIRPDWKREDLEITTYSEGYINQMKRFHVAEDTNKDDAIVVRVFGSAFKEFVDRKREFLAMQIAYAAGCFQPILAIFKNGVAYKFAHGRTLTTGDLNNPRITRGVTRKLAQLHTVDIDKLHLVDGNGQKCEFDKSEKFDEKIEMMLAMYPDKLSDPEDDKIFQQYGLSKEAMTDEYGQMLAMIRKNLSPTCLSHADFHIRNIIFDEDTGNVTFVDYEMTEVRPQFTDLHNLLQNRPLFELVGIIKPDDPDVTEEAMSLWRRSYMEAKYELLGKDPASIPDVVMEKMDVELLMMEIGSFLGMSLAAVVLAESKEIPVQFIKLLPDATKKWEERKGELPGLVERYRQLSAACANMENGSS